MNEEPKTAAPKKLEFSKFIVDCLMVSWFVVLSYAMWFSYITLDTELVREILSQTATIVGIILGFYFWKSKAENMVKIRKELGQGAESIFTALMSAAKRKYDAEIDENLIL